MLNGYACAISKTFTIERRIITTKNQYQTFYSGLFFINFTVSFIFWS